MENRILRQFMFSLALILFCIGLEHVTLYAQDQQGLEIHASATSASDQVLVPGTDCQALEAAIQQQKGVISRELGQIKREIAALRNDLSKPGIQDIIAGLGYIFGLAGIWLYVSSKKSGRV
jgi:hypothetical protein